MAISLVQSAEGAPTATAVNTASFGAATTAGNLVVLCFASADYNGTPDTGWTQSTGMEQQTFHGGYVWWRISTGQTNFQYTIGSAEESAWVLTEWSGVDSSPYDTSSGQFQQTSTGSYTTPSITPSTGNKLLIAAMGGSSGILDLSADYTSWLNSFTHVRSSGNATGDRNSMGVAYLLVTGNGSTSYSSGATYPTTVQAKSGMIISFKEAAGGAATSRPVFSRPSRFITRSF
jgi:hypothetical protein